jgi:GT2 family glycosyltransferase
VIDRDFALMAESGINAVRIPHTMPPRSLLDAAGSYGLKVMVGLSAEQYAGYLADRKGAPDLEQVVREKVAAVAGHPAILCYALGNEIQPPLARWLGRRTIERYLERLCEVVRDEDPGGIVTYVNYPTTEYLDLPFLDLLAFNVYLEKRERLEAYLARLHSLAGDRPVLMSELGLDALRNGEDMQANALDWQIRQTFASGCAGAFVFSWTDEWFRAGEYVDDWAFGLTGSDRTPKPALATVTCAFTDVPFAAERDRPRVSVVVCTFNGGRTLRTTLEGIERLEYPELEVIVVDDGSTDDTAEIAAAFDGVRLITTPNGGLASARNVGAAAATGEIVAYVDADAWPDPHWLHYIADTFDRTGSAAVGGPNIAPSGASAVAESVARSPGGPVHVLVSDTEAEHIPGCNFSIRKDVLEDLGGFDPQFRAAGDDVDLCWRLQEAGHRISFNPAAMVWHHRRSSVRAYWRQQRGYGRAEALLERKWPQRYNAVGHVSWGGDMYGNAFARLAFKRSRIYNGVCGFAPFQTLYQGTPSVLDALARLPEWYLAIGVLACLSGLALLWAPLVYVVPLLGAALLLPLVDALYSGVRTRFGRRRPRELWRLRAITSFLHATQPLARLVGRIGHGLTPWRRRRSAGIALPRRREFAVWLETWRAPEDRLANLITALRRTGLAVRLGGEFDQWDAEVRGGMFAAVRVLLAAEDHGAGTQHLRFRIAPRYSRTATSVALVLIGLAGMAAVHGAWVAAALVVALSALFIGRSMFECAVATAAALGCLAAIEKPDEAARDLGPDQLMVDRAAAPLHASRV